MPRHPDTWRTKHLLIQAQQAKKLQEEKLKEDERQKKLQEDARIEEERKKAERKEDERKENERQKKLQEDERKVVDLFKKSLDDTKKSLDTSATNNRNWLVILVSLLAAAVTLTVSILDVDLLLRKEAIDLPLISVKVPLWAFYYGMPILVLLLHFDVLQNLREHDKKLKQWLLTQQVMRVLKPSQHIDYLQLAQPIDWQILSQYNNPDKNSDNSVDYQNEISSIDNQSFVNSCAVQLFPFVYDAARINYGENNNPSVSQHLTALSAWLMYVAAPVLVMLIFLVRFADLQEIPVTLWHTLLWSLDLLLVYVFWPSLQKTTVSKPVTILNYVAKIVLASWFLLVMGAWTAIQILHFSAIASAKQNFNTTSPNTNLSLEWWHISEQTQITWRTWLQEVLIQDESEKISDRLTNTIVEMVLPRLVITPIQARLVKLDEDGLKLAAVYNKNTNNSATAISESSQHRLKETQNSFKLHNIDAQTQRQLLQSIPPLFDFSGRRLAFAELSGVWLPSVPLTNADVQGATLYQAQLQGAQLSGAQLQGAKLYQAQLQGANLSGAQLQGANLSKAQLQRADLTLAQLQRADLTAAQLQRADFTLAQLQGANLTEAQLQGADLTAAQLQGANLTETQLQGADLTAAQLQGAILTASAWYGAQLLNIALSQSWTGGNIQWQPLTKKHLAIIKQLMPKEQFLSFNLRLENAPKMLPAPLNISNNDAQRQIYLKALAQLFCQNGVGHTILQYSQSPFFIDNRYTGLRITEHEVTIFQDLINQAACKNSNTTLVSQRIDKEYAKYNKVINNFPKSPLKINTR